MLLQLMEISIVFIVESESQVDGEYTDRGEGEEPSQADVEERRYRKLLTIHIPSENCDKSAYGDYNN